MQPLITVAELAEVLNTSPRTIHRLNSAGKIPRPVMLGNRPRWRHSEIMAWIDAGMPPRQTWEAVKIARRKGVK